MPFDFSLERTILSGEELTKNTNIQSFLVMDTWERDGEIKGALIDCIQINSLGLTKPGPEGFMNIQMNIKGLKNIKVVVHNEGQFYNPNYYNLFGSELRSVNVVGKQKDGVVSKFYLTRNHLRFIDQPKDRCGKNLGNLSTNMCIMNFLRHEIGCHVPLQNMEPSNRPPCNKTEQFEKLMKLGYVLEHSTFTESQIYETTRCLSPFKKVVFFSCHIFAFH